MDYTTQTDSPQTAAPMPTSQKAKWYVIAIVAVLIVAAALWYFFGRSGKVLGASTTSTYQAVFLSNGQVYFGKLSDRGDWIDLSDIYYLQVTQNLQNAASADASKNATPATNDQKDQASTNIQLVKLGSELHGPMDTMHIERDKVLFWEDMKSDSKVVQAINQYRSK